MNRELWQILFGLFGGLAVFIYGMNLMSEGLQKAAGEKMKTILGLLTRNPVMGVLAGALVTAVLQSSSATTVMAIGFVSAGLMSLPQSISIILGANIGTTMTAQLLAFKISDFIYVIIFAGFLVNFAGRGEKTRAVGQTVFAFGLLFEGIEIMGGVMQPLASSPVFTGLLGRVADMPVLGVALGTVMTVVVQSSSATIAVLQNFAAQAGPDGVSSVIGLAGAIPVLLGDNIGTTITALLASIGQSRDAKRTALAHCVFNISGCLLFIWFVKPYARLIAFLSPKGPEVEVISRQIANAHTLFNVTMTVLWVPLLGVLVRLVTRLVPDGPIAAGNVLQPHFLDRSLLGQPAAALHLVALEVLYLSGVLQDVLRTTAAAVRAGAAEPPAGLREKAAAVHTLSGAVTDYMAELYASGALTGQQADESAGVLYILSDIDRIGLICDEMAANIAAHRAPGAALRYTDDALREIADSLDTIDEMFGHAVQVLQGSNAEAAASIRAEKDRLLDLDLEVRRRHASRVKEGLCSAALTAPFGTVVHGIDRMGNACVNIAEAALGKASLSALLQPGMARPAGA